MHLSKSNCLITDNYWKHLLFLVFLFLLVSLGDIAANYAYAASTASDASAASNDVIGNTLCKIIVNLSGNTARAVATIAIFSVGVGLFLGKVNWGIAAVTAIGVAIIFGANNLVNWLSGASGSCTTAT